MNRAVATMIIAFVAMVIPQPRAESALTIHVDMDLEVEGIQPSRVLAAGEQFQVALVLETDAAGIAAYGISMQYDHDELQLVEVVNSPLPPMIGLSASITNKDLGDGLSVLSSFDGVTLSVGPSDASFVAGTITFTALAPVEDGALDIIPGFFAAADGAFDNTLPFGKDLTTEVTIGSGSVSTEPSEAEPLLPTLAISQENDVIVLFWPSTNANVIIEQSENLQTDSWVAIDAQIQEAAGRQSTSIDTQSRMFFRLASP